MYVTVGQDDCAARGRGSGSGENKVTALRTRNKMTMSGRCCRRDTTKATVISTIHHRIANKNTWYSKPPETRPRFLTSIITTSEVSC